MELKFSKRGISIAHPVEFSSQAEPYYLTSIRWYEGLEVWHETKMGIPVGSYQALRFGAGNLRIIFNEMPNGGYMYVKLNEEDWVRIQ